MRRLIILAMAFLAMTVPAAAQFVAPGGAIPAVANIRGENNTFWQSDVSILNVSSAATSVQLFLFPELKNSGPAFEPQVSDPIPIPGNGQLTLANVVTSVFGLRNVKGGVQIISDGAPLVLASRTYIRPPEGGSYGLNVYGSLVVSETAWVANVEHDGFFRTNVGVFVPAGASPGNPPSKMMRAPRLPLGRFCSTRSGSYRRAWSFSGWRIRSSMVQSPSLPATRAPSGTPMQR